MILNCDLSKADGDYNYTSNYLFISLLLVFLGSASELRGTGAGPKKIGVTSAVSDESVAGDSGVYEPSERKYEGFTFEVVGLSSYCYAFIFPGLALCFRNLKLQFVNK